MVKPSSARPYDPAPTVVPSDPVPAPRPAAGRAGAAPRAPGRGVGAGAGGGRGVSGVPVRAPGRRGPEARRAGRHLPGRVRRVHGFGAAARDGGLRARAARWRITAVFGTDHGAVPCRSLAPDKGYEAGLEWRTRRAGSCA
ncbi:hypothetical protein ACU686_04435 [Yinghuangia aomiensis]